MEVDFGNRFSKFRRAAHRLTPPRGARSWNSVREDINQSFVEASIRGLVAELLGRCPRLDLLVNNAGLVARSRTMTASRRRPMSPA